MTLFKVLSRVCVMGLHVKHGNQMSKIESNNNFDLLRLFAAFVAHHANFRSWMLRIDITLLLFLFVSIYWLSQNFLGLYWGSGLNPLGFIVMAMIALRFGFIRPDISGSLLNKNDVSYEIYIYHMPIINFFIYVFGKGFWQFYGALIAIFIWAIASWLLIEKQRSDLRFMLRDLVEINKSSGPLGSDYFPSLVGNCSSLDVVKKKRCSRLCFDAIC